MNRRALLPVALALPWTASAAGELVPEGKGRALALVDHDVHVVLDNGFARTEVVQTFRNDGDRAIEATYRFPLPESAALSEMAVTTRDGVIRGEVVGVERATALYEDARARGEQAALATKEGHTDFAFRVASVPAHDDAVVRFVYYQPLDLDTGIGRYVYPLEPGGAEEGRSFWHNPPAAGDLTLDVELKSAWPVTDVRTPGWEAAATVARQGEGHLRVSATLADDTMDRDLVLYYRLADELPGRVEVVSYKPAADVPGTFLVVVTPGADLEPLEHGVDTVFLLDTSGSMEGTIRTLGEAVSRALGELGPLDRFRVVTFDDAPHELVGWTPATPDAVARAQRQVEALRPNGGTNLYAALGSALSGLQDGRATSVVLVTDAGANEGEVRPQRFHELLAGEDVRFFGFVVGNGANLPLMEVLGDATGGFTRTVSNDADLYGEILLARSKMSHEALHDARLTITGAKTRDLTGEELGRVFRGEQLLVFGRYDRGGPAKVTLDGEVTGEARSWTTTFTLPEVATEDPELDRLWALASVEQVELERDRGDLSAEEAAKRIRLLGLEQQLVTSETAMVALTDAAFAEAGVDRANRERIGLERTAQDLKAGLPARSLRVDTARPAFSAPAPSLGGGGALDPLSGGLALGLGGVALWRRRSRR